MMRTLAVRNSKLDLHIERRTEIARALFPIGVEKFPESEPQEILNADEIEERDVKEAAVRLKSGKAPGSDGLAPEVIKIFVEESSANATRILNNLYRRGIVPDKWNVAKLVLIPKSGRGDAENSSSYRSLYLIDPIGKLYEGVIVERLQRAIGERVHSRRNF